MLFTLVQDREKILMGQKSSFIGNLLKLWSSLDITEKVDLIERPPTEEIVTRDELIELFKTNSHPKHYIGLEISGFFRIKIVLIEAIFGIFF